MEVLLALVVGAFVMTFAIAYVVSLGNIWLNRGAHDFFQQHTDGVTLFLHSVLASARGDIRTVNSGAGDDNSGASVFPIAEEGSEGRGRSVGQANTAATGAMPIAWGKPPGYSAFDPPLIMFHLDEAPALLTGEGERLPALTCFLLYDDREGLFLLWYSRLSETEDLNGVMATPLSPFLTGLRFAYYDREANTWEALDKPKEDDEAQRLLPDALLLTFTKDEETRQSAVYLPRHDRNVPLF